MSDWNNLRNIGRQIKQLKSRYPRLWRVLYRTYMGLAVRSFSSSLIPPIVGRMHKRNMALSGLAFTGLRAVQEPFMRDIDFRIMELEKTVDCLTSHLRSGTPEHAAARKCKVRADRDDFSEDIIKAIAPIALIIIAIFALNTISAITQRR